MPWQPQGRDRTKALALVLLLHLCLGAALLHGLAGEPLRPNSEALATLDLPLPQPPPLALQRRPEEVAAKEREAGASDLEARPAPTVVPLPLVKLPIAPTLATPEESAPDDGRQADAGSGLVAGTGVGAGGAGDGTGGGGPGGAGSGGPESQARLVSGNLSRGDYRRIRAFGAPRGQAVLGIEVDWTGRISGCQPLVSSGNPALDAELCRLLARTGWEPARDRRGNPVAVALRYVASWDRD